MGYRLNAQVPNVEKEINVGNEKHKVSSFLELGKQYDVVWDDFNYRWFGDYGDGGLIHPEDLEEFLTDLIETNNEAREYKLYNLDILAEVIKLAIEENYHVYFCSF